MTDLEKESYSKQEVHELIQDELKTVHVELNDLKLEIDNLNRTIDSQRHDYDKLKKHLSQLAAYVEKQKQEAEMQVPQLPDMTEAIREVKEVGRYVDKAINSVIIRAEKMEKMVAGYVFSEKDRLLEEITHIFEACNVQDLTAQRIKKVLEILGDKSSGNKKEAKTNPDGGVKLEHGPQLPENAMSQEEIDKMLKDL